MRKPDFVFLDLDKFLDLNKFRLFFSTLLSPSLSTLETPTTFSLGHVVDPVFSEVFNIEVSDAAIQLNPWMNYQ